MRIMNKETLKASLIFVLGCIITIILATIIWTLCFLFFNIKSTLLNITLCVGLMIFYYRKFKQTKWGKTLKLQPMPIIVNLDVMMAKRKISLGELAERIDLTPANLSILKTGKAKAVRFSTLEAICRELNCQPGDILEFREGE